MSIVEAVHDPARLAALRRTGLLGSPQEQAFDRLARLAALALRTPVALISLVDSDRQHLTSSIGLPEPWASARETPHTLCAHLVARAERLVVPDVRADPVLCEDEVAQVLGVAAYAGTPLVDAEGFVLGALCAIDHVPRAWTADEIEALETLAAAVSTELELRATAESAGLLAEDKQAILESSLDCILVMDHDGIIREWNPAAERTLGYERDEAVGRRLSELIIPEELRDRHEEGLLRAARTGENRILGRRLRLPALRKDGSTFTAEVAITKIMRGGQAVFTGTIRDITDVVRAENELRAAEERYRTLIENIPLVTYMHDVEARFSSLYISPQVESLLGWTAEEWMADPDLSHEAIHPDDREQAQELARQAREQGIATRNQVRFVARDGRVVWALDHTIPVRDETGTISHYQGFLLDVTERKQLEDQLRQSQKLEAIGQLAGGIAHDFNNMLTAINGYAELLGMSFEDGDPRQGDLDELKRAADHAAALTRQLLAFSRKQVLLPKRLDVNEIVSELEGMLRRTIGEQIELSTTLPPELAAVEADRDQLAQVVLNIALNARDAMPAGGCLSIATRDVELPTGPHVAIEISDTGSGMDEETRLRVFEPFFTTKEVGKGTGLGLATAYGVVSQSGGSIEVESEQGRGSIFRVVLPSVAAESPRAAA